MVVCGFSSVEGMALINVEGSGLIGIRGVDKRIFGTLVRNLMCNSTYSLSSARC